VGIKREEIVKVTPTNEGPTTIDKVRLFTGARQFVETVAPLCASLRRHAAPTTCILSEVHPIY